MQKSNEIYLGYMLLNAIKPKYAKTTYIYERVPLDIIHTKKIKSITVKNTNARNIDVKKKINTTGGSVSIYN